MEGEREGHGPWASAAGSGCQFYRLFSAPKPARMSNLLQTFDEIVLLNVIAVSNFKNGQKSGSKSVPKRVLKNGPNFA